MQPSEIENLPYYEYEYMIEDLEAIIKEKNEAENGGKKDQTQPSIDSVMRGASKYMPKQGSFKFPSMPKF